MKLAEPLKKKPLPMQLRMLPNQSLHSSPDVRRLLANEWAMPARLSVVAKAPLPRKWQLWKRPGLSSHTLDISGVRITRKRRYCMDNFLEFKGALGGLTSQNARKLGSWHKIIFNRSSVGKRLATFVFLVSSLAKGKCVQIDLTDRFFVRSDVQNSKFRLARRLEFVPNL